MRENAVNKENIGFLQSEEWRKFQEKIGKRTFCIEREGFLVNIIEHELPIVEKYFYVPRGLVIELDSLTELGMINIIDLAKKEKAGWIRFDAESEEILGILRNLEAIRNYKIVKAPHDMQPREIFVIDITKSEEQLLSEMKSKTRYNIKLAQKKGVKIAISDKKQETSKKYINEFIKLVNLTASRKGISFHPGDYYRKMIETIPEEMLKLYIAEYEGKIIAANLVVFYGKTAIYLHGATDDEYRNVMAPYLLQWQAILDAKNAGFEKYDFGGIKSEIQNYASNGWAGITKFKIGFSPNTKPIEFSGSYDIVLNPLKYKLYRIIQKAKTFL